MTEETKKEKNILDKSIDFIFSNDERKWLIPIFILGVLLRFLGATNISLLGDEAIHGPHIIGFLHAGLISSFAHSPLWFFLGDIALKFLGVTVFSLRFTSFFFGAVSILVVYLIAKKMFDSKIGLLSAFFLSVSFFTIRYTLMEMDLSCLFFVLMAVYFFLIALEAKKFPWLAAVCIGLAALIKTLSLFFVPAFIIGFFLFTKKDNSITTKNHYKKIMIQIVLFGLIISAIFLPILAHNYFLCQDKGIVDVYFGKYFKDFKNATGFPQCLDLDKAQQAYGMQLGYDESTFEHARFFEGWISMSKAVFDSDPLIIVLSLLGILLAYSLKEKRKYWFFLMFFNLFGFSFLVLTDWLTTHIVTMMPVLCIFAAVFTSNFSRDIGTKLKVNQKKIIAIVIVLVLIFQLNMLWPFLSSTCATSQMRDYAINNMDKNSLVITDSRIYTGRVAILFNDFHYLDASLLSPLLEMNDGSKNQIPVKIYYLECASDDCGWGTMKDNPALNQSMEEFTASFSQTLPVEKTILGGGGYDEETGKPYFRVYQGTININPELIPLVDSTHNWWYYPVNYRPKNMIFDNYNVNGFFNKTFYLLMWIIIWISIILALILSFYPFYLIIRNKN
ncbi:MAG: glycosyltransferase family 39 protein [archaeon]|nr:glycosyltransferase family 39 protein [archaeon]